VAQQVAVEHEGRVPAGGPGEGHPQPHVLTRAQEDRVLRSGQRARRRSAVEREHAEGDAVDVEGVRRAVVVDDPPGLRRAEAHRLVDAARVHVAVVDVGAAEAEGAVGVRRRAAHRERRGGGGEGGRQGGRGAQPRRGAQLEQVEAVVAAREALREGIRPEV